MRVALYQINSDRDTFNTKFMSWRWRTDHDYIILPEEYDIVGDARKFAPPWLKSQQV